MPPKSTKAELLEGTNNRSISTESGDGSVDFFVARQPIFKADGSVYAYELLFRSCRENTFDGTEGNLASAHVISNSFFSTGAAQLLSGKRAFINFPADLLIAGTPLILSPQVCVVEILETVEATPAILEACWNLKKKGYLVALDDYSGQMTLEPLLEFADIIKVDFQAANEIDRKRFVDQHRRRGVQLLAEKVETQQDFEFARETGYCYFQGYFFARPKLVTGREVAGFKLNYLRILAEINRPDLNFRDIVGVINQEISLASKLLRYINSAAFSWRGNISSLQQALALLGEKAIRHWVSAAALLNLAKDKPGELITLAILRARFCELIASRADVPARQQPTLFLIGMFSLLDAILDRPLDELLSELPLSAEVRNVLLGDAPKGDRWAEVFAAVKAYEAADWATLSTLVHRFGIPDNLIPQLYLESADWSNRAFRSASTSCD